MQIRARNRLLMWKSIVAARRVCGSADNESWAWVIPLKAGNFRIRAFDVRRELLANADDLWDGNLSIVHDEFVATIDEVDDAVRRAGVDPEELDAPWKCDFPL